MNIKKIVIHCAASPDGKQLSTASTSAAQVIDRWHATRGFQRSERDIRNYNSDLRHIGYHWVIDTDGNVVSGRKPGETGAHAKGFNTGTLGVCLVGTAAFTLAQWASLKLLIDNLLAKFPDAVVTGHRDLSPDLNGDGKITPNEYLKTCPGFDVAQWLENGKEAMTGHVI